MKKQPEMSRRKYFEMLCGKQEKDRTKSKKRMKKKYECKKMRQMRMYI